MSYASPFGAGPKTSREKYETLNQAWPRSSVRPAGDRSTENALGRTYAPDELVAARIELKGASRPAGIDVRGDGSLVAWTGRVRRTPLEGRDPLKALRQSVSVEP